MSTIYANLDYQRSKHQYFSVYIDLIIFLDKNSLKKGPDIQQKSQVLHKKKKIRARKPINYFSFTQEYHIKYFVSCIIKIYFCKEWEDERLEWDAAANPGVSHVYALNEEIWTPELFIDNSLSTSINR